MIIDRIQSFIAYKRISKSKFYKETGLSNGFLDKVKDIGSSKVESILKSYPEINITWLLLGEGAMLHENESMPIVNANVNTPELLNYLLNNNDVLLKDESFRNYIKMNMEYIATDEEREEKLKALEKLKKLAKEKYAKKGS